MFALQGAGELRFADDDVIEGLLTLISEDHSHKVKAAAIEGLEKIIQILIQLLF